MFDNMHLFLNIYYSKTHTVLCQNNKLETLLNILIQLNYEPLLFFLLYHLSLVALKFLFLKLFLCYFAHCIFC
nr:MAG TPA_asm: hypothetical protein [Bacteriophage sp.]